MPNTIRLHRHPLSGHAHRVELFLSLLSLPHELVDVDLVRGAHKEPAFIEKSPFGQVPVIEDGEVTVSDSAAILVYLARRFDDSDQWLPRDPVGNARVQQWLSVAAGQLAYGPAAARLVKIFGAQLDHERAKSIAHQLYAVLEKQLEDRQFLVGDRPTIADIALYSYSAHAPEGGVSLADYPHVRSWLARIEGLPGFVAMKRTPLAEAS